jgi:oligo-1,6-glucosidase
MGYDISDFEDIHVPYGTLGDCRRLIDETHRRGMRIIFNLAINHTSDQHEWFKRVDLQKRDWHFWRPAKYDKDGKRCPRNN